MSKNLHMTLTGDMTSWTQVTFQVKFTRHLFAYFECYTATSSHHSLVSIIFKNKVLLNEPNEQCFCSFGSTNVFRFNMEVQTLKIKLTEFAKGIIVTLFLHCQLISFHFLRACCTTCVEILLITVNCSIFCYCFSGTWYHVGFHEKCPLSITREKSCHSLILFGKAWSPQGNCLSAEPDFACLENVTASSARATLNNLSFFSEPINRN